MGGIVGGGLGRLEYRLVAVVGMWYCGRRGVRPGGGLVAASEVAAQVTPSAERLMEAGDYVFRMWCRVMYALIILLVAYGFAFDGLFYSRGNVAADAVIAVLSALVIATVVEITVIKIRLGFVNLAEKTGARELPRRALPKVYDFWSAVVVAVVATPVLLFGVYLPTATRN